MGQKGSGRFQRTGATNKGRAGLLSQYRSGLSQAGSHELHLGIILQAQSHGSRLFQTFSHGNGAVSPDKNCRGLPQGKGQGPTALLGIHVVGVVINRHLGSKDNAGGYDRDNVFSGYAQYGGE